MTDREEIDLKTQPPPSDHDAERSFVGGLLRNSVVFDELDVSVPAAAIYHPQLRLVYVAMLELRHDNEPVDAISVFARVVAHGWVDKIGGEYEIPLLLAETMTAANVPYYAGIILDHYRRRLLIAHATEAVRDAHRFGEPTEIIARLESRLCEIDAERADSVLFETADVADEVIDDVRVRKSEGRTSIGVPTGFYDLDALTGGLVPSELFIIGARPSQGKTALAVNMLRNASKTFPVLLVSIEMGRMQIVQRLLAGEAGVDSQKIRMAAVNDAELTRLQQAAAALHKARFHLADIPGATISDVVQAARQTKRKHPDLAVVAVDYMQLIRKEDRRTTDREHVGEVSGRLKSLARSLGVCVLGLSQLNRKAEDRKDRHPEMGDLRESGNIEQDADVIALLHRPEQHDPEDRPGEADLIVPKVRNGPIGEVLLTFDKSTTTFRNAAQSVPTRTYDASDF